MKLNLQETECKAPHNTIFILLRQRKRVEYRHRQNQDVEIRNNVDNCVRDPEWTTLDAVAPVDGSVPVKWYWTALKYRYDNVC